MNLNYLIGKIWSEVRDFILRQRPSVLWDRYPRGNVFPMNLARFAGDQPILMVLDVGANDGGTALEFSQWFPQARIHSFEPVKGTFCVLQRRVRNRPMVASYQVACGAKAERVLISLKSHSTINTLVGATKCSKLTIQLEGPTDNNVEEITVITVDYFCSKIIFPILTCSKRILKVLILRSCKAPS